MKLQEIIDAGIGIEGDTRVKEWDEAENDYIVHFDGHTFTETNEAYFNDLLDMEVDCIYAIADVTASGMPSCCLVIEVTKED